MALAGAASGAMSGAVAGSSLGPWGALGGAVVGGVMGALSPDSGEAAKQAAENQARLAQLESEKSLLNVVLATYEAKRVQQETALDLDYLGFATERQVSWLGTISEFDRSAAKAKAAIQGTASIDTAMGRAEDIQTIAESQAQAIEAEGASKAAQVRTQNKLKAVLQDAESAKAIGLKRANFGARGVAYTGSALDVMNHEEQLADIRQKAITLTGSMQVDDIQLETTLSASLKRQAADVQAAGLMRDARISIDATQAELGIALTRQEVETQRDVALTEEEGWRTAMKLRTSSQNTVDRTMLTAANSLMSSTASQGSAAAYSAAGDSAESASLFKAGSSLLTGAKDIFKAAKTDKWFG